VHRQTQEWRTAAQTQDDVSAPLALAT